MPSGAAKLNAAYSAHPSAQGHSPLTCGSSLFSKASFFLQPIKDTAPYHCLYNVFWLILSCSFTKDYHKSDTMPPTPTCGPRCVSAVFYQTFNRRYLFVFRGEHWKDQEVRVREDHRASSYGRVNAELLVRKPWSNQLVQGSATRSCRTSRILLLWLFCFAEKCKLFE